MHQNEIVKKFMINKVLDVVETAIDNSYVDSRSKTRLETMLTGYDLEKIESYYIDLAGTKAKTEKMVERLLVDLLEKKMRVLVLRIFLVFLYMPSVMRAL